ncbi:YlmH family RNA-binding protein [Furfurilactobacillus siliginis]|uniref:Cell division protein n=1 Tax=Furfurilactobacillus siliginis TaxID=348151 RepID=A0A0R2L352_9LACO|nr:RNA-binding protein [Furfurilactobacillus siliginis]KRN96123.1 cell division protein [Furfurilactobacillus siliginis]GEK27953.1 RNA-binding protein [Furfurilactobacillus siliginis]
MDTQANIMQHFRSEEAPFVEEAQAWLSTASQQYRPYLTGFLNPRQVYILQTLVNGTDGLKAHFNGGYPAAEQQRALIFPDYYEPQVGDFELQLFEIVYPTKFAELHHSMILGTLANLGIDTAIFGDILTDQGVWQVFVAANMAEFFKLQVDRVGKIKVHLSERELSDAVSPEIDWTPLNGLVASLRLDTVVAEAFNLSRNRAKGIIESGDVRLNWMPNLHPDADLGAGDMVSVRHFGRVRLDAINGKTRKDKLKIDLSVVRS